jgi:hydrogenase large subunit
VENIQAFRDELAIITAFVRDVYIPDVVLLGSLPQFQPYSQIGRGCGNLIAYGVFDLDSTGSSKLFPRGRYTDDGYETVEVGQITEYVRYSRYTADCGNKNPAVGETVPEPDKTDAYSWIKSPRYLDKVHEAGPLARMWISGDYRQGISVIDRLAARAQETLIVAQAMDGWLNELQVGQPAYAYQATPASVVGIGLTEAPRGALGHWIEIDALKKITRYQVITPTAWNASPRDDMNQLGPIEQALLGTPVADEANPVELLRVVHSFDPCLACSVHMIRPGREQSGTTISVQPCPV